MIGAVWCIVMGSCGPGARPRVHLDPMDLGTARGPLKFGDARASAGLRRAFKMDKIQIMRGQGDAGETPAASEAVLWGPRALASTHSTLPTTSSNSDSFAGVRNGGHRGPQRNNLARGQSVVYLPTTKARTFLPITHF